VNFFLEWVEKTEEQEYDSPSIGSDFQKKVRKKKKERQMVRTQERKGGIRDM